MVIQGGVSQVTGRAAQRALHIDEVELALWVGGNRRDRVEKSIRN